MDDGTLKGRRRGMSRPRGASAGKVRFVVRGEANCCKQCLTPWHKEQKEEEYWGGNFGHRNNIETAMDFKAVDF